MEKVYRTTAIRFLTNTTRAWFIITYAGQLLFAYYVVMLYWRSAMNNDFSKWNTVNPHFFVSGDGMGNVVFGLHVALAAVVTIFGPLQLVKQIRNKAPRFHRISGRIYICSALLIASGGLYLTWVRGAVGGPVNSVVISVNAIIIIACAYYCIRRAMQRDIRSHNQWAVHLLLAMSGVWLFRVFLMLWLLIFRAPVGFDPQSFTGPFLYALAVFVYILPQGVVLLYFKAKFSETARHKYLFSILLLFIAACTALGIVSAAAGMWLPRI